MKDVLVKKDPKSAEIIRPILRGRDIKRYKFIFKDLFLICTFPSLKINIEDYPVIKQHLLSFGKDRLEQSGTEFYKNGVKISSRKKTQNKWYETQDTIAYWEDFDRHKIIWAELARTGNSFAFDDNGFYCLAGAFILTFGDNDNGKFSYKYLVSLLNHPTTLLYLEYVYSKLDSTGWQWKKEPIEKIPIPRIDITKQNQFESLYDEYINALEKEKIEALVEIDKSIFDLYCFNSKERSFTFSKLKVFTYEAPFFT